MHFFTSLWFLLLYLAAGFVLVLLATLVTTPFCPVVFNLHLIQWLQNVVAFILPVLCWVRFYLKEPILPTLQLRKAQPRHYLVAIAAILILSPLMDSFASWVKEALPWPETLRQMAEAEAQQQEQILAQLLSLRGLLGWTENILLMCVVTAVAEEFVFRGALLTCFHRAKVSRHVAAILVGLIFALIHFDLYGLLPRWLLGTLFCYLLFWSQSLLPAILAHALNNLLALLDYCS